MPPPIGNEELSLRIKKWAADGRPDPRLRAVLEEWSRRHQVTLSPEAWQLVHLQMSAGWEHEVDRLGVHGIQEQSFAGDGDGNFRVTQGDVRVLESLASGLHLVYHTPVDPIRWSRHGCDVETTPGETYTADRVVVTLPLGVLQAGEVRLTPRRPAGNVNAIGGLWSGPVRKGCCVSINLFGRLKWPVSEPRSTAGGLGDAAIPTALDPLSILLGADIKPANVEAQIYPRPWRCRLTYRQLCWLSYRVATRCDDQS